MASLLFIRAYTICPTQAELYKKERPNYFSP